MRLTALALVALLAAACGGDDADDSPQADSPPASAATADTLAADTLAANGLDDADPGSVDDPARAAGPDQRADAPAGARGARAAHDDAAPAARADGGLYTVQVAAFIDASSANEWADRLRRQGLPVWTSVAEVSGRTFHRLRVGAVPSVSEARRLGRMLTERYEWPVWVAPLTPADRVPQNAVDETRRVLEVG